MYDVVAGIHCLKGSYVLSKSKALELFPMLKKDRLVGAIVYYDGEPSAPSCQEVMKRVDHRWSNRRFALECQKTGSPKYLVCEHHQRRTVERLTRS